MNNEKENEIVVIKEQPKGLSFYISSEQLCDRRKKMLDIMRKTMKENTDWGKIPGCGNKPTLLKAGAEKIASVFGLCPMFLEEIKDLENGHRDYNFTCTVNSLNGIILGQGIGSCSTMESKYRYTNINTGKTVPKEYWNSRNKNLLGGIKYSTKKFDGEWMIVEKGERIDVADVYNTVKKMAKKRAFVDAIITVTGCSDLFTQDIEDMQNGALDTVQDMEMLITLAQSVDELKDIWIGRPKNIPKEFEIKLENQKNKRYKELKPNGE